MRRALAVLTLLASLAAGALSGCRPAGSMLFSGPDGPVPLRQERAVGVYRLRRPVAAVAGDRACYLEYSGAAGGRVLRLLGPDGEPVAERALIDIQGGPGRILVPLPPDRPFSRIVIEPPPDRGLVVHAMGLAAAEAGFAAEDGVPTGGMQVRSWRRDERGWEVQLEEPGLPGPAPGSGPAWRLELDLECRPAFPWARFRAAESVARGLAGAVAPQSAGAQAAGSRPPYTGPERAAALIIVSDGREERRFLYQGLSGRRSLYLYPALVPFVPRRVRVEPLAGSRLWLDGLSLVPGVDSPGDDPAAPDARALPGVPLPGPLVPLPADPGVVLAYPREAWRDPLYELYSWSLFPEVLIFDTADYAAQARFFKRLAFFVEKRGYRGRLAADREIENLHGFNAHDYRAEDLARFFQQAAEQEFPLLPEEEQLRGILIANGILERREGVFLPGRGAVISISRSSGPLLRRHLLTHEAFHGVFFMSEAYRESARALWDELGEGERAFWLLFFRWVGYDTADEYLSANELQAYLFQQERRWVGSYFRGVTAGRLLSAYPDRRGDILGFLGDDPGSFERRFDTLERALIETVNLEGGRVVELTELPGP